MTPDEAAQFPVGCRVKIVFMTNSSPYGTVAYHSVHPADTVHVHVLVDGDEQAGEPGYGHASSMERIYIPASPEEVATAIGNLEKILEDAVRAEVEGPHEVLVELAKEFPTEPWLKELTQQPQFHYLIPYLDFDPI